jgi:hypothetical protein
MKLMKNKLSLNRPLLKTALFSTFALACVTTLAQTNLPLVFTEVPGNGLIATLGLGGPSIGSVTLISGGPVQTWDWSPPSGAVLSGTSFGGPPGAQWLEPPPLTVPEVNRVTLSALTAGSGLGLMITSDVGTNANLPMFNDKSLDPQFIMPDPSAPGGAVVGMKFIDNGDATQTVPDGGLTLGMLGTAMAGLALSGRRFQALQPGVLRQARSGTVS